MKHNESVADPASRFVSGRYGLLSRNQQRDDIVARCLRQYGEWAQSELDLLARIVLPGHCVLEFGGNYAAQTLCFTQLVGDTGQVHVAEPQRLAFQQVCANLAINGINNVHAHELWLTLAEGTATQSSASSEGVLHENVRAATVDSLKLTRLDLLKISIPGVLETVLAGAHDTLRQHRPCIYFLQGDVDEAASEVKAVKERGYRCWSHISYIFNPDNSKGDPSNAYPGRVLQNIIAFPSEAQIDVSPLSEV